MELKPTLFVVMLVLGTAFDTAAAAEDQRPGASQAGVAGAKRPGDEEMVDRNKRPEEKSDIPAERPTLDFKELFGCEPMGEGGHTPLVAPPADKSGGIPDGRHERMEEKY